MSRLLLPSSCHSLQLLRALRVFLFLQHPIVPHFAPPPQLPTAISPVLPTALRALRVFLFLQHRIVPHFAPPPQLPTAISPVLPTALLTAVFLLLLRLPSISHSPLLPSV